MNKIDFSKGYFDDLISCFRDMINAKCSSAQLQYGNVF